MERHHIALPQQYVDRHRLDRGGAAKVAGQHAAAEPPSLSSTAMPMRPVPTTPTVMPRSSFRLSLNGNHDLGTMMVDLALRTTISINISV